jgi:hypothetical protein
LFLCYEEPLNKLIRGKFRSKQKWVGVRAVTDRCSGTSR